MPVSFIIAVATDITQATGKYCVNGHGLHFAHIWLTIIHVISVAVAFLRLLQFYKRLRAQLREHNVLPKLVAIKGVVFLSTLQSLIFSILSSSGAVKPSPTLSYDDFYFGIPSILICGEMLLFSLYNFHAYSVKPYTLASFRPGSIASQPVGAGARYHGGFLGVKALLAALNPTDLASGLVLAVKYLFSSPDPLRGYDEMPLRQGRDAGAAPACDSQAPSNDARYQEGRGHSPNPVEYGRVERYTPLSR